jgi:hypothetical protein
VGGDLLKHSVSVYRVVGILGVPRHNVSLEDEGLAHRHGNTLGTAGDGDAHLLVPELLLDLCLKTDEEGLGDDARADAADGNRARCAVRTPGCFCSRKSRAARKGSRYHGGRSPAAARLTKPVKASRAAWAAAAGAPDVLESASMA